MLIVNKEISQPAGRDQGFPIALDLRTHTAGVFVVFHEIR